MPGIPALGRMRQEDGEFQANLGRAVRKTKVGSGAGRVHFRIPLALLQPGCLWFMGHIPCVRPLVPRYLWRRGSGLTPACTTPLQ